MTIMDTHQDLATQQDTFRAGLEANDWLLPTLGDGVTGLGPQAEDVVQGIASAARRIAAELSPEVGTRRLRFPPVNGTRLLERTDYVASFPQLLGTISAFEGDNTVHRKLLAMFEDGGDWSGELAPAGHALVPAVCHPLYAYLEGSQVDGTVFELTGECYRHEPSPDPMRFVTFRMFEAVRLGTPAEAREHRETWLAAGTDLLRALGLTVEADTANDPFFGRAGKLLSAGQREAQLKFEILTEVYPGHPTAIASANLHEDHFGEAFHMHTADGAVAHSACFGFGLERVALALAAQHGFDVAAWPAAVRQELGLS
ncbi:hypothetical protein CWC38_04260 [Kocuria tytonicola]|uniref:hypothetical protein n=1 Tax=Kocuria tytonicola TaxID=2055946 RepID=UPI000EF96D7C|nr:hypothetical protein [Kocuria tytonicola]RLZ03730.1 hypothetical protein CWC38_04260 [Kocuria tytonicola]